MFDLFLCRNIDFESFHTGKIELQRLRIGAKFVKDFGGVVDQLERLDSTVNELSFLVEKASKDLDETRLKGVADQATRLKERKEVAQNKKKLCDRFLEKFKLSEDDFLFAIC